ncbi:MAG: histidine phosphatase family protein, partial [Candidatus Omnitrophica bacterium]|nr:histidine phosphatase family protein [Candidatus Omnitrophota bacterium]
HMAYPAESEEEIRVRTLEYAKSHKDFMASMYEVVFKKGPFYNILTNEDFKGQLKQYLQEEGSLKEIPFYKNRFVVNQATGKIKYPPQYKGIKIDFDLWVTRHGKTRANTIYGMFQGDIDEDDNQLIPEGEAQAQTAAKEIFIQLEQKIRAGEKIVIVTSPLKRSKDMALAFVKYVGEQAGIILEVIVDPRATEMSYGVWENKTMEDVSVEEQEQMALVSEEGNVNIRPFQGESVEDLLSRSEDLLLDLNQQYAHQTVVLFGHKIQLGAIRILLGDRSLVERDGHIEWRNNNLLNASPMALNLWSTERPLESTLRNAVIFGLGGIARGLLGDLLQEAKYSMTFIGNEREKDLVRTVIEQSGYRIGLLHNNLGPEGALRINRIYASALSIEDPLSYKALDEADIILVSTFPKEYDKIASLMVKLLRHRIEEAKRSRREMKSFNVIIVSNQKGADLILTQLIIKDPILKGYEPIVNQVLGVSSAVVDRIIPSFKERSIKQTPIASGMFLMAENYNIGIQVSKEQWRGDTPKVEGVFHWVEDEELVRKKKLYTLNMAHAIAAYMGHLKGYTFVHEAMADEEIHGMVKRTLRDILAIYPQWSLEGDFTLERIIKRISNPLLCDPLVRVGRNPVSKLAYDERLVGVALELLRHSKDITDIAKAIAAALLFDEDNDREYKILQELSLDTQELKVNVSQFLRTHSRLDEGDHLRLIELVVDGVRKYIKYRELRQEMLKIEVSADEFNEAVHVLSEDVYKIELKRIKPKSEKGTGVWIEEGVQSFLKGELFNVSSENEQSRLRELYEEFLRRGLLQPQVIVHIKNLFQSAVALYLKELMQIAQHYNGNVDLFLVVEGDVDQYNHDFSSTYNAVNAVLPYLDSSKQCIHVADAGWKVRNSPSTLAFGYQGLMPFSGAMTYVHQAFLNTGAFLLQLPSYGTKNYVIVPSDSVFFFGNLKLLDNRHLNQLSPTDSLLLGLVPTTRTELDKKVVAGVVDNTLEYVVVKPTDELYRQKKEVKPEDFYTLPFLQVWSKERLEDFINGLKAVALNEQKSFLSVPVDFFIGFIEPLFINEGEWLLRKSDQILSQDWLKLRLLALEQFGLKAQRVTFMTMARNSFIDEGHAAVFMERIRKNIRKEGAFRTIFVDSGVKISGGYSLRGSNIIITGKGRIIVGHDVTLENVLIDLGDNGNVIIPSGWVIRDSFIGGKTLFVGENGYLNSMIHRQVNTQGQLSIYPVEGSFPGNAETIMVITTPPLGSQEIIVSIHFSATHQSIMNSIFGQYQGQPIRQRELRLNTDIVASQDDVDMLRQMIDTRIRSMLPVRAPYESMDYERFLQNTVERILRSKLPGKAFWTTISGIQGAGKTLFAKRLTEELKIRGHHVIFYEEDWAHKPRGERQKLKAQNPQNWKEHRLNWHRWDKYRADLSAMQKLTLSSRIDAPKDFKLKELYNPQTGLANETQDVVVYPDTIFIVTGFFVEDGSTFSFPDETENRLRIYLDIPLRDSLKVKLDRDHWRSSEDIVDLHNSVYAPSFREYKEIFKPWESADIAVEVRLDDRQVVEVSQKTDNPVFCEFKFLRPSFVRNFGRYVEIKTEIFTTDAYEVWAWVKGDDENWSFDNNVVIRQEGWRKFAIFNIDYPERGSFSVTFVGIRKGVFNEGAGLLEELSRLRNKSQKEKDDRRLYEFNSKYGAIWMNSQAGFPDIVVAPLDSSFSWFVNQRYVQEDHLWRATVTVSLKDSDDVLAWVSVNGGPREFKKLDVRRNPLTTQNLWIGIYESKVNRLERQDIQFAILNKEKVTQDNDIDKISAERRDAERRGTQAVREFDKKYNVTWSYEYGFKSIKLNTGNTVVLPTFSSEGESSKTILGVMPLFLLGLGEWTAVILSVALIGYVIYKFRSRKIVAEDIDDPSVESHWIRNCSLGLTALGVVVFGIIIAKSKNENLNSPDKEQDLGKKIVAVPEKDQTLAEEVDLRHFIKPPEIKTDVKLPSKEQNLADVVELGPVLAEEVIMPPVVRPQRKPAKETPQTLEKRLTDPWKGLFDFKLNLSPAKRPANSEEQRGVKEIANQFCPVTERKIPESKEFFIRAQGQTIYFNSKDSRTEFIKNYKKYINNVVLYHPFFMGTQETQWILEPVIKKLKDDEDRKKDPFKGLRIKDMNILMLMLGLAGFLVGSFRRLKKNSDPTSTKDGQPLSLMKLIIFKIVVNIPSFIHSRSVEDKSIVEAIRSLNHYYYEISAQLQRAKDDKRIRAGPEGLFNVLAFLGIHLNAFNLDSWIIIHPELLQNPKELHKVLIHEAGAVFGLSHDDNLLLQESSDQRLDHIRKAIKAVIDQGRVGISIDPTSTSVAATGNSSQPFEHKQEALAKELEDANETIVIVALGQIQEGDQELKLKVIQKIVKHGFDKVGQHALAALGRLTSEEEKGNWELIIGKWMELRNNHEKGAKQMIKEAGFACEDNEKFDWFKAEKKLLLYLEGLFESPLTCNVSTIGRVIVRLPNMIKQQAGLIWLSRTHQPLPRQNRVNVLVKEQSIVPAQGSLYDLRHPHIEPLEFLRIDDMEEPLEVLSQYEMGGAIVTMAYELKADGTMSINDFRIREDYRKRGLASWVFASRVGQLLGEFKVKRIKFNYTAIAAPQFILGIAAPTKERLVIGPFFNANEGEYYLP